MVSAFCWYFYQNLIPNTSLTFVLNLTPDKQQHNTVVTENHALMNEKTLAYLNSHGFRTS